MCNVGFLLLSVFNIQNEPIEHKCIPTQDNLILIKSSRKCTGVTPMVNSIKMCLDLRIKILIRNPLLLKQKFRLIFWSAGLPRSSKIGEYCTYHDVINALCLVSTSNALTWEIDFFFVSYGILCKCYCISFWFVLYAWKEREKLCPIWSAFRYA